MGLRTRPPKRALRRLAILLAAPLAVSGVACRSVEEELLSRFLEAETRRDTQTVALLSMISFPGEVQNFRLMSIGKERRGPYRVAEMRTRVREAEARRDEQFKRFGDFRQANYDELVKVQRLLRDDPGRNLEARQASLQRQWEGFREERRVTVTSLHEAQQALEWEIRCVQKSLQRESEPEYLTGETLTKNGSVRVTTKEEGEGAYGITLTRYDLKNSFGAVVPTRWIVTAIERESR